MILKNFFKNLNKDFANKSFKGFEFNSKKIKKNYIFFAIHNYYEEPRSSVFCLSPSQITTTALGHKV